MARSKLTNDPMVRSAVFSHFNGICAICEKPVDPKKFHLDHIIPLSRGGADTVENLQLAHPRCNISKGNATGDLPRSGNFKRSRARTSDDFLFINLPADLKLRLKQRAKSEHRSMSNQVVYLIEKYLRECGSITPTPSPISIIKQEQPA